MAAQFGDTQGLCSWRYAQRSQTVALREKHISFSKSHPSAHLKVFWRLKVDETRDYDVSIDYPSCADAQTMWLVN